MASSTSPSTYTAGATHPLQPKAASGRGARDSNRPTTQGYRRINAADVSVYAFTTEKGSRATGDTHNRRMPAGDPHDGLTDVIGDLAEYTGGSYTPPGVYDLTSYLGSFSREQSDYYRLGYTPSASAGDKPCHKLQVKVDRSGLKVNARQSYCASAQPAAQPSTPRKRRWRRGS